MNLLKIVVRVTEMSVSRTYNYRTHGETEVYKVRLTEDTGEVAVASLHLFIDFPVGAPNSFRIGQRVALTIDAEAVPAVPLVSPSVSQGGAEAPLSKDVIAIGLGASFDRDVIAEAPVVVPATV